MFITPNKDFFSCCSFQNFNSMCFASQENFFFFLNFLGFSKRRKVFNLTFTKLNRYSLFKRRWSKEEIKDGFLRETWVSIDGDCSLMAEQAAVASDFTRQNKLVLTSEVARRDCSQSPLDEGSIPFFRPVKNEVLK